MFPLLLAAGTATIWYMVPLIVSVSLVYAATRHELLGHILRHAARFGGWITVFMAVVMCVLWILSRAVQG